MAYLNDMPKTCKARGTDPKLATHLLESISSEFEKGMTGDIFDASYVRSKLESLLVHVKWLEQEAIKERAKEFEPA